jgi:hypothetical protein
LLWAFSGIAAAELSESAAAGVTAKAVVDGDSFGATGDEGSEGVAVGLALSAIAAGNPVVAAAWLLATGSTND